MITKTLRGVFLLTSAISWCQTTVLENLAQPSDIFFYGNELYFGEQDAGTISKIDVSQPVIESVEVASGLYPLFGGMVLYGNNLYTVDRIPGAARLLKFDLSQTSPVAVVAAEMSDFPSTYMMHLEGSELLITHPAASYVSRWDLNSEPLTVAGLIEQLEWCADLELYGSYLYFIDYMNGVLYKKNMADEYSVPAPVVSNLGNCNSIKRLGNELYIFQSELNKISKINLSDSSPQLQVVAAGLGRPTAGAYKDGMLYFSEISAGRISKIEVGALSAMSTKKSDIVIYPNPASSSIKIEGATGFNAYKIFAADGKFVSQGTLGEIQAIDVSSLHRGAYILYVAAGSTAKFVKY